MKILSLHGWNSVVGGVKPTHLKSHGHEVYEPALDHDDFEAALWGPARPALPGMEKVGAVPHGEARDADPSFPG